MAGAHPWDRATALAYDSDRACNRTLFFLADVKSSFYVAGVPIGFDLEGVLASQDLRFCIGNSRVFLGGAFSFLDATNSFEVDLGADVPETLLRPDLHDAGMAAEFVFEGRDNSTMPTRGRLLVLKLGRHDEALGGNFGYWNATLKFLSFHPLHERFVLGLRLQSAAVDGSPPFFGYPWVTLRGVPAMRYQGKWVGAVELEGRFLVAERWSLLAFGGEGFTANDLVFFDEDVRIDNLGAGVRWRIFNAQDVWVGVDFARGPEQWNWYLQVNQAW